MDPIILHHFAASPFSEKIRLILGYKQLEWRSVLVPRILPKPDLLPLTGGYRRTPVMQIGRDLYCDTRLIAREIDRRHPQPALIPPDQAASVLALEHLGDQQLFLAAIPILFLPAGRAVLEERLGAEYLARFQADRDALFAKGNIGRPDDQFSRAAWAPSMEALDAQLADRAFLVADQPTLADCAVYHPVWYVLGNPGVAPLLDPYPNVLAWATRMAAIGHGRPREMDAGAALDAARDAGDFAVIEEGFDMESGRAPGQPVTVAARDYGGDPVFGSLVHLGREEIVLGRENEDLGGLRVHFPRRGFVISS